MSALLKAENDYHAALANASKKADEYSGQQTKKREEYIEALKGDWRAFESSEKEKFEQTLLEDGRKMEAKAAEQKKRLRTSQQKKADAISERLKEEVLAAYGGRQNGKARPEL
ncbi:MAG: hypothetical protein FWG34_14325 [Oscillospiraceae bacterium]|nr:hypothetical protein [Oscillospiraceae bacterium]